MAGIGWTMIHPLALILIYYFVFSIVIRVHVTQSETGTDEFLIFFLTGLLPWLIFSDGLMRATSSLVANAELITKVVFPVELLPASSLLAAVVSNGIGLIGFFIYLACTGFADPHWLLLIPLFLIHLAFTWGLAFLLSALCVFIRDVQELLGIVLMVWFFSTPILYPLSYVPPWVREFILLNPMAQLIQSYRDIVLLHQTPWVAMIFLALLAWGCMMLGYWFFQRTKPAFGDVL